MILPHPCPTPQIIQFGPDGTGIPLEMCSSSGGFDPILGSSIFIVIGPMVRHFPGWPMYAKNLPRSGREGEAEPRPGARARGSLGLLGAFLIRFGLVL